MRAPVAYSPIFLALFCLSSCSQSFKPIHYMPVDAEFEVAISSSRNGWSLKSARQSKDLFCRKLMLRVIYDNPTNYLESGETVKSFQNQYIRRSEPLARKFTLSQDLKTSQIRSVSIVEADCRLASIGDLCGSAEKTAAEANAILAIGRIVGAKDCTDLDEKYSAMPDNEGFRVRNLPPTVVELLPSE